MSDQLFCGGGSQRERRARTRARSESFTSAGPPSSQARKETSEPPASGRGSLVLSTSNENVPRRETSKTPATLKAAAWAIPSSSSCVVCGNLSCSCQGSRPDREVVRRKLESLRLNTPYERAKLQRSVDELRTEEAQRRRRCADAWEGGLLELQGLEQTARVLHSLAQKETRQRARLVAEESGARHRVALSLDQISVLTALAAHERESRQTVVATEEAERTVAQSYDEALRQHAQLSFKELCGRRTIEFSEGAKWEEVLGSAARAHQRMLTAVLVQRSFAKTCMDARDAVESEWASCTAQLLSLEETHRHFVDELLQRQAALTQQAFRSAAGVGVEETQCRERIQAETVEDFLLVSERARLFARCCQNLERMEATARQGILEEVSAFRHNFFLEFTAEAEEATEMANLRIRRRDAEARSALDFLESIATEEEQQFAELLSLEYRERDQRYAWITSKVAALRAFENQAADFLEGVATEEEVARRELLNAARLSESAVHERAVERSRQCRDVWARAVAERAKVEESEQVCRQRLRAQMTEHEDSVRQWCDYKTTARTLAATSEQEGRAQLCCNEAAERDCLCAQLTSGVAQLAKRERDFHASVTLLVQAADAQGEAIARDAASAYDTLAEQMRADWLRTVAAEHYRVMLELCHSESAARASRAQEETVERGLVERKFALDQRYLTAEMQHRIQSQVTELQVREQTERGVIVHDIERGYQALYEEQQQEELAVVRREEERIAAELRAREQCLQEDSRLYATVGDEDPLCVPEDACGQQACTTRPLFDSDRATTALRLNLVLQALELNSEDAAAALGSQTDRASVDFLVAVVDSIGARRADAQEWLAGKTKRAREAARRAAQREEAWSNEKERKEAYTTRLSRESEEQQRRLHMDKADRQRGSQVMEADRKRLDTVLSDLELKKSQLEELKSRIHKQFSRA